MTAQFPPATLQTKEVSGHQIMPGLDDSRSLLTRECAGPSEVYWPRAIWTASGGCTRGGLLGQRVLVVHHRCQPGGRWRRVVSIQRGSLRPNLSWRRVFVLIADTVQHHEPDDSSNLDRFWDMDGERGSKRESNAWGKWMRSRWLLFFKYTIYVSASTLAWYWILA